MGSVKDLQIIKKPEKKKMGVARFTFSDRYSVFDWGEMPDHIPNKGAALCLMGTYCMEKAQEDGINTHCRGLVRKDGKVVKTNKIDEPVNVMEVDLVQVIYPKFKDGKYNYSAYTPQLVNFLLPLEVIYRNGLPQGSSVFKRLAKGDLTIQDLGLDHQPQPGDRFEKPFFDVSTKLEERDRYMSWQEAQKISGLSSKEIEEMKDILLRVNNIITQVAGKVGLVNEDGKMELACGPERELMLVDIIGTLDECRFTYQGKHVSKEIARQFYRRTGWYQDVETAKKQAEEQGVKNWKDLCKSQPPKLNTDLKRIVSQVYMSTANAFLGRDVFDSPKLEKIMDEYADWLAKFDKD